MATARRALHEDYDVALLDLDGVVYVSHKPVPGAPQALQRAKAAGLERTDASQFDAASYDIVLYYAWAMREAKVTGDAGRLAQERTAIRDALLKMAGNQAAPGKGDEADKVAEAADQPADAPAADAAPVRRCQPGRAPCGVRSSRGSTLTKSAT